jgi:site-specific recombinase XerD
LHDKLLKSNEVLGKSKSTFNNYIRQIAKISLHYGIVATKLTADQVEDYLYHLKSQSNSASESTFKHTIYGLRFMLKQYDLPYTHLKLPKLKPQKSLPVVLSKQEVFSMLEHAPLLKHKILIGLLYGCGLRCFEVRNIRLRDLDFDRQQLHVTQGKGKKPRYVPLSKHIIRGLKSYISAEKPKDWLFNGQPIGRAGGDFDGRYSQRGVQWAINQAVKRAGIAKRVTTHTLRHTYATHLLEDGLDIMSIKELMGHARIETTLVYLHVAQLDPKRKFSPLDTLFERCKPSTRSSR